MMPARLSHISLDALPFPVSIPVIPAIFWNIFAILCIKYHNRISHKINVDVIIFYILEKHAILMVQHIPQFQYLRADSNPV